MPIATETATSSRSSSLNTKSKPPFDLASVETVRGVGHRLVPLGWRSVLGRVHKLNSHRFVNSPRRRPRRSPGRRAGTGGPGRGSEPNCLPMLSSTFRADSANHGDDVVTAEQVAVPGIESSKAAPGTRRRPRPLSDHAAAASGQTGTQEITRARGTGLGCGGSSLGPPTSVALPARTHSCRQSTFECSEAPAKTP